MRDNDWYIQSHCQGFQLAGDLVQHVNGRTATFDVGESINEDSFDAILTGVLLCCGADFILVEFFISDVQSCFVDTGQLRVDRFLGLTIAWSFVPQGLIGYLSQG